MTEADTASVCILLHSCLLHPLNSRNLNGLFAVVHLSKLDKNQVNVLCLFYSYFDSFLIINYYLIRVSPAATGGWIGLFFCVLSL